MAYPWKSSPVKEGWLSKAEAPELVGNLEGLFFRQTNPFTVGLGRAGSDLAVFRDRSHQKEEME